MDNSEIALYIMFMAIVIFIISLLFGVITKWRKYFGKSFLPKRVLMKVSDEMENAKEGEVYFLEKKGFRWVLSKKGKR